MKVRLTQKDLLFGIYWGPKGSLNSGLNIWWRGHFIYPATRGHSKRLPKEAMLFQMKGADIAVGNSNQEH